MKLHPKAWTTPWYLAPHIYVDNTGETRIYPNTLKNGVMWIRCFAGGYRYFYPKTDRVGENYSKDSYVPKTL